MCWLVLQICGSGEAILGGQILMFKAISVHFYSALLC